MAEGCNDIEHPREALTYRFIGQRVYSKLMIAMLIEIGYDGGADKAFVDDDVPVIIVLLLHC